jgi:CUB domain
MKLLLASFLALNLAVGGWAVPIEYSVGENTARSFKQFLTDLVAEENGPSVRTNCDLTLTATTGTITSPNYPQNYPASLNCYWIIASSTRTVITLSFDGFVLEQNFDFLRVCLKHFIGLKIALTVSVDLNF